MNLFKQIVRGEKLVLAGFSPLFILGTAFAYIKVR